mmetsp:Transcript_7305/g.31051  ORF Transcript_7305/g.31051 Transcript_7305/m.31051 type:complete len:130 (-) Transcript_7305:37-426(-)
MPQKLEEQALKGKRWECFQQFHDLLECLEENKEEIGRCQKTFENLHTCSEKVEEPGSFLERARDHLFHNRFLVDSDNFGRKEGALSKGLQKIAPQVFDPDAERKKSPLTESLQAKFPHVLAEDDDDDED